MNAYRIALGLLLPCLLLAEERMLFLGSSSTFYNDIPTQVGEWVSRTGGTPLRTDYAGVPVIPISDYLPPVGKRPQGIGRSPDVLAFLREQRYGRVALQLFTGFLIGKKDAPQEGEVFRAALTTYCQVIREAGGEPVFYEMGWGLPWGGHDAVAMDTQGRALILAEARRLGVRTIIPASRAWQRVRARQPDLDLHDPPDRWHPGHLGTYLILCCAYATCTGKRPDEGVVPTSVRDWVPEVAGGKQIVEIEIPKDTRTLLQACAWEAHLEMTDLLKPLDQP